MIFRYFSQNESVILKMDSCTLKRNKRNTRMLYDCRDIGRLLDVTLLWIQPHPPKSVQNTWPRVGNNIDSRDNRFVYG